MDKENSHDYILEEKVWKFDGKSLSLSDRFRAVAETAVVHDSNTTDTDSQGGRQKNQFVKSIKGPV